MLQLWQLIKRKKKKKKQQHLLQHCKYETSNTEHEETDDEVSLILVGARPMPCHELLKLCMLILCMLNLCLSKCDQLMTVPGT